MADRSEGQALVRRALRRMFAGINIFPVASNGTDFFSAYDQEKIRLGASASLVMLVARAAPLHQNALFRIKGDIFQLFVCHLNTPL